MDLTWASSQLALPLSGFPRQPYRRPCHPRVESRLVYTRFSFQRMHSLAWLLLS